MYNKIFKKNYICDAPSNYICLLLIIHETSNKTYFFFKRSILYCRVSGSYCIFFMVNNLWGLYWMDSFTVLLHTIEGAYFDVKQLVHHLRHSLHGYDFRIFFLPREHVNHEKLQIPTGQRKLYFLDKKHQ